MNKLKIYQDNDAQNPRTEWDAQCPLITRGGRNYGDNSYGIDIVDFIRSKLNKKNMYKISNILGYKKEDISDKVDKYIYYTNYSVIEDIICDIEKIEYIEKILNILKVPCYSWTSRGYSQGDRIDCILVATDDRVKTVGIKKKDIADSMKNDSNIFNARAWGDVYSYRVFEYSDLYNKDGELSDLKEEIGIDGCSGYYGDDGLKQIFEEVKTFGITEEMFEDAKENIIY